MPQGLEAKVILTPTPIGQYCAAAEQLATEQQMMLNRRNTSGALRVNGPLQTQPAPTGGPANQQPQAAQVAQQPQPRPAAGSHPLVRQFRKIKTP